MAVRRQEVPIEKVSEGIGPRIREARKLLGLTQQKLSDLCGHSKGQIAQWEIGVRTPGIDGVFVLASTMKISFLWLATGQGEARPGHVEEGQPRWSAALFEASVRFASHYISENDLPAVLDVAEFAKQVYMAGAKEGFDSPGKSIEECMEFLRGAVPRIRVLVEFPTTP